MKAKLVLAAMLVSLALCTPAFSADSNCRGGHVREWLKAVSTVQCKTCILCQNPPAEELAKDETKKEEPKDTPKADAAPAAPAPPPPAAAK
jgi:hypothetical protein